MSNKPMKAGDRKQQQEKLRKKMEKKSKESHMILPPFTYIATEGTITEVNYLEGFVKEINKKYGKFSRHRRVVLEGYGRSCLSLLEDADRQIKRFYPNTQVVWLVYDKDDFPRDDFDNTQHSAESRKDRCFKVAWSNESVELWFLLHFQDLRINIGRVKYIEKLKDCCDYSKNSPDLFKMLADKTSAAVDRSRKLMESYDPALPPSAKCPGTLMQNLIEELNSML